MDSGGSGGTGERLHQGAEDAKVAALDGSNKLGSVVVTLDVRRGKGSSLACQSGEGVSIRVADNIPNRG